MAEFLFEIGFEEMPAPWLAGLADQLKARFLTLARDEQLMPADVRVLWTSRRLVLVAQVKAGQDDRTVVEWGPAAKIAKDAAGNWSKAAEGFAKKQGVPMDALKLAAKAEGFAELYVSATKRIAGRPSGDVMADLLPAVLRGFNFPKRMNWDAWLDDGRGAFEFGRPIRWLVALLDGEVVPVTIFDAVAGAKETARVASGRRSTGNRFYPRGAADRGFSVRSFSELESGLAARFVILDPARRTERIRSQVKTAGGDVSGEASPLLDEWSDLVEYPTVVVGTIPKEFGDLPDEVLETVLAHHQKAVTLPRAADGSPRFAAISGGDEGAAPNVAQGQERVVVARLKDARFFYNEDRKRTLESRVDDLAAVTFHKGLGSYLDKVRRMTALTDWQSQRSVVPSGQNAWRLAGEALRLSKADLTTLMVREFPELQGTMGGLYSAHAASEVAAAVRWQYFPFSMDKDAPPAGRLTDPEAKVFSIVALVDKLDTLVTYFVADMRPSGSSDPLGLRRAGQGVIRLLLDFYDDSQEPSAYSLVRGLRWIGAGRAPEDKTVDFAPVPVDNLSAFLVERLRTVLVARGHLDASVDACLFARDSNGADMHPLDNVRATERRVSDLEMVRGEQPEVFAALAESFKRAKNIVGETQPGAVDQAAFVEAAEGLLHAAIVKAETTPPSDPAARLRAVAALRGEVDAFFKGVMVMAGDPRLKANRLALLSRLLNLVYEVADLSKLASPAGENAASS